MRMGELDADGRAGCGWVEQARTSVVTPSLGWWRGAGAPPAPPFSYWMLLSPSAIRPAPPRRRAAARVSKVRNAAERFPAPAYLIAPI